MTTKQEKSIESNSLQNEFNLSQNVFKLLLEEPFFSVISREIDKSSTTVIPSAGVRFNEKTFNFELIYNSSFMACCNEKQRLGVLKHEFYHIMFDHLTTRRPFTIPVDQSTLTKEQKKELAQEAKYWNYATDLAINSHLDKTELPYFQDPNNPKKKFTPLKPGEDDFKDFPPFKTAEWYFAELKKKKMCESKEGECNCDEFQFDVHDWDNLPDEQKEIIREKMRTLVKKAVNHAAESNSWGTISNHVKEYVIEMAKDGYVSWEKELSYFVKKTQKVNKSNTHRKINRKYPYIHPGRKNDRRAHVVIGVDQSGSVYDEMLAELTGPLNALSKIATFTVVPFDYDVCMKGIFKWKKGEHKKIKRVAGGGTSFDCITDYVNDHSRDYDGLVILTDMEAPKPKPCKVQRMWITTEQNATRPYFQTNEKIAVVKKKKGG